MVGVRLKSAAVGVVGGQLSDSITVEEEVPVLAHWKLTG